MAISKKSEENFKGLEEEIGDILFSLICTSNAENIDLSDAWKRKLGKVNIRNTKRFTKK